MEKHRPEGEGIFSGSQGQLALQMLRQSSVALPYWPEFLRLSGKAFSEKPSGDCLGFGGACPFLRRVAENVIREGVSFPVGSVPGAWRGWHADPALLLVLPALKSLLPPFSRRPGHHGERRGTCSF